MKQLVLQIKKTWMQNCTKNVDPSLSRRLFTIWSLLWTTASKKTVRPVGPKRVGLTFWKQWVINFTHLITVPDNKLHFWFVYPTNKSLVILPPRSQFGAFSKSLSELSSSEIRQYKIFEFKIRHEPIIRRTTWNKYIFFFSSEWQNIFLFSK